MQKYNIKINQKGITLIALVITIIVLLILAGVSIALLTGNNGILTRANEAKEETEIGKEKENIKLAMTNMKFEKESNIVKRKIIFQNYLDELFGINNSKAYINGKGYIIYSILSNKVYAIDEYGNVNQDDIDVFSSDITPGSFDGTGTEVDPYMIMSIEDLVEWSKNYEIYSDSYIKLGRDLDFQSELSYCNYMTNEYNEIFGISDKDINLFEILTNEKYNGFIPINRFSGTLDGNNKYIKNIYINSDTNVGGIITAFSGEKIVNLNITGKIKGNGYVGGICSTVVRKANVYNCTFSGVINNTSEEVTYQGTGGIIGRSMVKDEGVLIEKCIVEGEINGNSRVGGILGYNVDGTAIIDMCNNKADIVATNKIAGGICGQKASLIINSYNIGMIRSESTAGGIGAYNCGTIINCYNKGEVDCKNTSGGIAGQYYFTNALIVNSYNIGDIASGNSNSGAIVGMVYPISTSLTLEKVYWFEDVADKYIGSGEKYVVGDSISVNEEYISGIFENNLQKELNNYVEEYNNQNVENKTYTNGRNLQGWIFNIDNKCPTFNF